MLSCWKLPVTERGGLGRAGFGVGCKETRNSILDMVTLLSLQETPAVISNVLLVNV